jgi:hypothetical protein
MGLAQPEKLGIREVLHHRNGSRWVRVHIEEGKGSACSFACVLRTPCRFVRRRPRRRRHASSLRESHNLITVVVCLQQAAIAEKLKRAPTFQPPMCNPRRAGGCM